MVTRLFSCTSDIEWDEFNSNSLQGSIFSNSAFLNALKVPHDKLFLEIDGRIVASALIMEPNTNELHAAFPYQGIALAPVSKKGQSAVVKSLIIIETMNEHLAERYECFSIRTHHSLIDLRAFQWFNYDTPEKGLFDLNLEYTGIIFFDQFKSFEEYLRTIRSSRRQDAKKIIKLGYSIEQAYNSDEFMRLYKLTFDRQSIEMDHDSLQRVKYIVDACISDDFGRLTFSKSDDGTVCSATVTLQHQHTSYYMFGATDPDYRSSGANTALLLESIDHSYHSGHTQYDMVGINSPQRGHFKTSFNADPVPIYSLKLGKM